MVKLGLKKENKRLTFSVLSLLGIFPVTSYVVYSKPGCFLTSFWYHSMQISENSWGPSPGPLPSLRRDSMGAYSAPRPQLDNAMTLVIAYSALGMIKPILKVREKDRTFLKVRNIKGVFLMTLYLGIWGETEKPRTMVDTQTFVRNDHLGFKMVNISVPDTQR